MKKYLIFDYGASHGRCLVASFDGLKFSMDLIHEFENRTVSYAQTLYWDILRLTSELDIGIAKAFRLHPQICSIGIDTWGCDCGFLDRQGRLIANPVNYRDEWRHRYKKELDTKLSEYKIFELGGANTNPIMSLYHLYALKQEGATEMECAEKFLMIPDLLNYYLTGETANEYTNATMSLLVDQRNRTWQTSLIDAAGIPRKLFLEIRQPGTILGKVKPELCDKLNIPSVPVVSVATHDTASAIAGLPLGSANREWAFISLGTWAIFGKETEEVRTEESIFDSGFANQGGVEGKNNLVNLITGLWVIQQCREFWNHEKAEAISWDAIVKHTTASESGMAFIDIQDPLFSLPNDNMPNVIRKYCKKTGQHVPESLGEVARVVYESMVLKFKECLARISMLTSQSPDVLHIVGGGVQNKMLCQWIADALQIEVKAGPTETTSVGNLLMQMRALGEINSIDEGRAISEASSEVENYKPKDAPQWNAYYLRYIALKQS